MWIKIFLMISLISAGIQASESVKTDKAVTHVLRLKPGMDLKKSLMSFMGQNKMKAASINTAVGSLTTVKLRFANQEKETSLTGHFEIVSLVGTMSETSSHLHMSVSNEEGKTLGGHLVDGNIIYTTAEIILTEYPDLKFERKLDPKEKGGSGYQELFLEETK